MNLFEFIPGYTTNIYEAGREPALIMLSAFLITFIITRAHTRLSRIYGWGGASIGGVHAHHIVFGLILMAFAGAAEFAFLPQDSSILQLFLAAAFGSGAALVLDEFALVFHLEDVYWEKEGRKSIDAVVIAVGFGVLFLLHSVPLGSSSDLPRQALSLIQFINLIFVIIAAVKGKLYFAVFGVFIPILAIVGAVRLAEPDSIWANKFYPANSKKIIKSRSRYLHYEKVWRSRKEKAWDIIGGKPWRPGKA